MRKAIKLCLIIGVAILFIIMPHLSLAYNYFELPGIKGYKPPQGFPWDYKPKTAEQVEYLAHAAENSFTRNMPGYMVLLDDRGHLRFQQIVFETKFYYDDYGDPKNPLDDYGDILDYEGGKVKQGDVKRKQVFQWISPPEIRARAFITWDYMDSPSVRKDADRWLYLPSARRIRRLSGGDREDSVGGSEWTYDDIIGREVFEMSQTFLGEDVLRPEDLSFDEKFLNLRLKNPVECYVIESKPKLPDYYLSKRILWVEKKRGLPFREEQYDKKGFLFKIFNLYYQLVPLEKAPSIKGSQLIHMNNINLSINHRTINWNPVYRFGMPTNAIPDEHFLPEFLRRETFVLPERGDIWKQLPVAKGIEDLPRIPKLLLDRFKEHRKIAPDVLERLQKRYGKVE